MITSPTKSEQSEDNAVFERTFFIQTDYRWDGDEVVRQASEPVVRHISQSNHHKPASIRFI